MANDSDIISLEGVISSRCVRACNNLAKSKFIVFKIL